MKQLFTHTDICHGDCVSEGAHCRRSARELFAYILRLGKNRNGFFYATTPDLTPKAVRS